MLTEVAMNMFIGTGRLTQNASVNQNGKRTLFFTLAAKSGYDREAHQARTQFVPCVLFSPTEKLSAFLSTRGQGILVEFQGRIETSKVEVDGKPNYRTNVVVDSRTLVIVGGNGSKKPDSDDEAKTK